MIINSKNHICWTQHTKDGLTFNTEFFVRNGEVLRAPISNAVMPDGYRAGRWECSKEHFDKFKDVILSGFDEVYWKE